MTVFERSPRGLLEFEEGRRHVAYWDTANPRNATNGIGHKDNSMVVGVTTWTDNQIDVMFAADYAKAASGIAAGFPQFRSLDVVRQAVLISMSFQMGVAGVLEFHHTLAAIAAQRWDQAAIGIHDSEWYTQTPARAERARVAILTGQWPAELTGEPA
jgi:lysozyme